MGKINIDFTQILGQVVGTIKTFVSERLPQVVDAATGYVNDAGERITALSDYYKEGDISEKFFLDRLKDEKKILVSQLTSFAIIGESIAQEAINGAMDALENLIRQQIPQN